MLVFTTGGASRGPPPLSGVLRVPKARASPQPLVPHAQRHPEPLESQEGLTRDDVKPESAILTTVLVKCLLRGTLIRIGLRPRASVPRHRNPPAMVPEVTPRFKGGHKQTARDFLPSTCRRGTSDRRRAGAEYRRKNRPARAQSKHRGRGPREADPRPRGGRPTAGLTLGFPSDRRSV